MQHRLPRRRRLLRLWTLAHTMPFAPQRPWIRSGGVALAIYCRRGHMLLQSRLLASSPAHERQAMLYVIFNPHAQKGHASQREQSVRTALHNTDLSFKLVRTEYPGHAQHLAAAAVDQDRYT